jgi:uncharacterized protein YndB with AHSA1/START domain
MTDPRSMRPVQSYEVAVEVTVRAPRERVWAALTADAGRWWPADFFTTDGPARFVIEPRLGGRVYEDWGNGGGVLWGTVAVWVPGYRMTWACDMLPDTTGPGRSFVTFALEDAGYDTLVRVQDAGSCTQPGQASGLGAGWQRLVGVVFKGHVEAAALAGDSGRVSFDG